MVLDLNKNFGRSTDLEKIGTDQRICIHPGDDQLFEYDDDSDNDPDGFVLEEDGTIPDMQSEELSFLFRGVA